jgi:hypothetical protein
VAVSRRLEGFALLGVAAAPAPESARLAGFALLRPAPAPAPESARFRGFAALAAVPGPMTLQRFVSLPPSQRPLLVVADGMGLDSSGVLEGLRRLGVRPDVIQHADTGDEGKKTVAFREVRQAWLRRIGFPEFVLVKRPPGISGKTGMFFETLGEKCIAYDTLPGHAFGKKSCSKEWKIEPQETWLAKYPPAKALWDRGDKVVKAIGYDAGPLDSRRAHKLTNDDRYEYIYPLREWGWDRARIRAELAAVGAPIPPKSACTFCPAAKPWEIAELVRDEPEKADQIVAMEDAARPGLRGIEGLWGEGRKGFRMVKGVPKPTGAIARPGSMALFIRQLRADPALLEHYLAMRPPEPVYLGPVGGIPRFRGPTNDAPPSRRRLPLVEHEPLSEAG